ncbi:MAG: D-glycero-beta-D-manno-heptose 1,7-bisphosphate 7-phosphatase [Pseudomonadota bacterium]|nr:D-glycero-beta-D-manno-heptose 1,7-bisphosphate 7-phosphatase [Pseudomonadota bacterium]
MSTNRLIILDRDGVINAESDQYIKNVDEWHPLPGSLEAVVQLKNAGYRVVLATNQSAIGRGLMSKHALYEIFCEMQRRLAQLGGAIDAMFYCPHHPDAHCRCRKPQPGMLEQIARYYHVSLDGVPFVGDASRDIDAARAAGAQPILVRTGRGSDNEALYSYSEAIPVFDNLAAFANAMAENSPDGGDVRARE